MTQCHWRHQLEIAMKSSARMKGLAVFCSISWPAKLLPLYSQRAGLFPPKTDRVCSNFHRRLFEPLRVSADFHWQETHMRRKRNMSEKQKRLEGIVRWKEWAAIILIIIKKIAEQQVTLMTRLFSPPWVKRGTDIRAGRETLWGRVKKERKKSIKHRMCALD